MVIANLSAPLTVGQTDNTLICDVSGTGSFNSITITYQWTRNDGATQTQVGNSRILNLSPLRLSHAGDYTCNVTINLTLPSLNITLSADNIQSVTIQSELINLIL